MRGGEEVLLKGDGEEVLVRGDGGGGIGEG